MYTIRQELLPETCKDCLHKMYDSGFNGANMPTNPSGFYCLKGRIMPVKSNRCNLKAKKEGYVK